MRTLQSHTSSFCDISSCSVVKSFVKHTTMLSMICFMLCISACRIVDKKTPCEKGNKQQQHCFNTAVKENGLSMLQTEARSSFYR